MHNSYYIHQQLSAEIRKVFTPDNRHRSPTVTAYNSTNQRNHFMSGKALDDFSVNDGPDDSFWYNDMVIVVNHLTQL
jgi:hypothetical protein